MNLLLSLLHEDRPWRRVGAGHFDGVGDAATTFVRGLVDKALAALEHCLASNLSESNEDQTSKAQWSIPGGLGHVLSNYRHFSPGYNDSS